MHADEVARLQAARSEALAEVARGGEELGAGDDVFVDQRGGLGRGSRECKESFEHFQNQFIN